VAEDCLGLFEEVKNCMAPGARKSKREATQKRRGTVEEIKGGPSEGKGQGETISRGARQRGGIYKGKKRKRGCHRSRVVHDVSERSVFNPV